MNAIGLFLRFLLCFWMLFCFPLIAAFSQDRLPQDKVQPNRFEFGLKGNLGIGGLANSVIEHGIINYEKKSVEPECSFSIGYYNLFYLNKNRNLSLSAECKYAFTSFRKVKYYEHYSGEIGLQFSNTLENRIVNHSMQLPLKLNYHIGSFQLGLGIVNALNLHTKIEQESASYDFISEEYSVQEYTPTKTNRYQVPKEYYHEAVYHDKIYDKLYVMELTCDMSEKISIGLEYSDYFQENAVLISSAYFEERGYSPFGSKQTNTLTISFLYKL